ncbi:response regulator [Megalodesulfovibrio gigas]|nr:response regulator [Megalodesulfovibrio gigas]
MTDTHAAQSELTHATWLAWRLRTLETPMQGLLAAAGQLQDRLDDPMSLQLVREMETAARAMARLVGAQPESVDPPSAEPFTLPSLLAQAAAAFAALARARGLRLGWSVTPAAQGQVTGDPTLLLQVLFALLDDSIQHSRTGEIRIQAIRPGPPAPLERVAISISDTAPAEPCPILHEPDMLQTLVRLLGGTMMRQHHAERGRLCTLLLPLPAVADPARTAPPPGPESTRPALPRTKKPRRILLVDDYPPGLASLTEVLQLAGHEVLAARDGSTALALHATHRPDVVFMDLQMPNMDGLEATRLLRQAEQMYGLPRTPVYAMTAFSPNAVPVQLQEMEVDGCIAKPVDLDALLRLLQSLP